MELSEDEKELIIIALGNLVLNIADMLETRNIDVVMEGAESWSNISDQAQALLGRFEKETSVDTPICRPNF